VAGDDLVHVADGAGGLQIVDVTDPTAPVIVGARSTQTSAVGLSLVGDLVYVADRSSGMHVIDAGDPTAPILIGSIRLDGNANGVAVTGNLVCVAKGSTGLEVCWVQCDDVVAVEEEGTDQETTVPIAVLHAQPNPFNPQVSIAFSLERPQHATLSVYDVMGRRVAVLVDNHHEAGEYSVVWRGTDVTGRDLPSGTYVVRLETERRVRATKVLLVR
jgi:hypothetical protein